MSPKSFGYLSGTGQRICRLQTFSSLSKVRGEVWVDSESTEALSVQSTKPMRVTEPELRTAAVSSFHPDVKLDSIESKFNLVTELNMCVCLQEKREDLHKAIRDGDVEEATSILQDANGSKLARAKNYFGKISIYQFVPLVVASLFHCSSFRDQVEHLCTSPYCGRTRRLSTLLARTSNRL